MVRCIWGASGFFTLSLAAGMAVASEGSSFADHAPSNTCFAVFSADAAKTCAAFRKSSLGKAFCGPDFAQLIKELGRVDRASPLHLCPAFGFDWSDLAKVSDPGGLMIFPLKDHSMGVVWLFTSAAMKRETPPCLEAARRYFGRQGFREATAQQAGVALTIFQPSIVRKSEPSRVLFVAGQFYGVANSQAAVDAVLNVPLDQSLASRAMFKNTLVASTKRDSAIAEDVQFFVRPLEFWELFQASNTQLKSNGGDALATARRLGLETLQVLAGRIVFDAAAPCEWELQAKLLAPRPFSKAMRLLEIQPGPFLNLPTWLNANITSAWFWRWDFPQAMKGFGNLFDEANESGPDGEGLFDDLLDGLRDDLEGVQVNLRTDVFGLMGPEVLRVDDDRGPVRDIEPDGRRWLYAVAVRDPPRVVEALTRFYRGDKRVSHTRSGDYEVWTVGEGASLFVEGESASLVTLRALAVGKGQMLLSMNVDLLSAALVQRNDGARLSDDVGWTRLLDYLKEGDSPQTAGRALLRLDRMLEPAYQSAASDKPSQADNLVTNLWQLLLWGTTERSSDLPYAALPLFDRLRSALPPAGMNMSQADDGWTIRLGALRPVASE